jgi:hypothetical protein
LTSAGNGPCQTAITGEAQRLSGLRVAGQTRLPLITRFAPDPRELLRKRNSRPWCTPSPVEATLADASRRARNELRAAHAQSLAKSPLSPC